MKPPKFLIAQNEAAQPGAAFIVHTQDPSFVGQILTFTDKEEMQQFVQQNDCIQVNEQVVVHLQHYLKSEEFKRFDWLKGKLRHWMIEYLAKK
jgi:hypothetical protein